MRQSSLIFEDLVNSLEEMVDLQDDAWYAAKDGKWRVKNDILEDKLPKAKVKFKLFLDEYLDRRFETYCVKNGIQRVHFAEEHSE